MPPEPADPGPLALPAALLQSAELERCRLAHSQRGYATLPELVALAALEGGTFDSILTLARHLCGLFNGGATAMAAMAAAARAGDAQAMQIRAWAAHNGLHRLAATPLPPARAAELTARLLADPEGFVRRADAPYPLQQETGEAWAFDPHWIAARLGQGQERLAGFVAGKQSDVAVLAGNGPSLRKVNPQDLRNADVFISNYALRDPAWRDAARGVAVTNRLVAAQDPVLFGLADIWRFHPVWLGHELADSPRTVWLNAIGGPLFFAPARHGRVAWHATVSYFWLQILFHAGYRRVALVGFDHSYSQPPGTAEGTLITQQGDDPNHFRPDYFRGHVWQAADTAHMGRTYALARDVYERAGRELVNSTDGGALEVLPRLPLAEALRPVG